MNYTNSGISPVRPLKALYVLLVTNKEDDITLAEKNYLQTLDFKDLDIEDNIKERLNLFTRRYQLECLMLKLGKMNLSPSL